MGKSRVGEGEAKAKETKKTYEEVTKDRAEPRPSQKDISDRARQAMEREGSNFSVENAEFKRIGEDSQSLRAQHPDLSVRQWVTSRERRVIKYKEKAIATHHSTGRNQSHAPQAKVIKVSTLVKVWKPIIKTLAGVMKFCRNVALRIRNRQALGMNPVQLFIEAVVGEVQSLFNKGVINSGDMAEINKIIEKEGGRTHTAAKRIDNYLREAKARHNRNSPREDFSTRMFEWEANRGHPPKYDNPHRPWWEDYLK